jgi:hypothetical protein
MRHAIIRIQTEEPVCSDLSDLEHDWSQSFYREVTEILPQDASEPLGNIVTTSHYVDASLLHDIVTGHSVAATRHQLNKTPSDWYAKKQTTVDAATYGSEFVAALTCVEHIIDLQNTLRYLGDPICSKIYMFGDNKSVVDSTMQHNAKLHKCHTLL